MNDASVFHVEHPHNVGQYDVRFISRNDTHVSAIVSPCARVTPHGG